MLRRIPLVAAGGAVGAVVRNAITSHWAAGAGSFPAAVLVVNLLGAFVIGLLHERVLARSDALRLLLAVGVLGGFTTFASITVAVVQLVDDGHGAVALSYLATTALGSYLAVVAGLAVGRVSAGASS